MELHPRDSMMTGLMAVQQVSWLPFVQWAPLQPCVEREERCNYGKCYDGKRYLTGRMKCHAERDFRYLVVGQCPVTSAVLQVPHSRLNSGSSRIRRTQDLRLLLVRRRRPTIWNMQLPSSLARVV